MDDPVAELKNLQETDGIIEYHDRFELLRTRVNFSEDDLVRHYLAGLRTDTQMHVPMFQPSTVRQCLITSRKALRKGSSKETIHPQLVAEPYKQRSYSSYERYRPATQLRYPTRQT